MEFTMRKTAQVLKISCSLNHGSTKEEAVAWLQEHATKNDFREKMAMRRENDGGIIGRVDRIWEEKVAVPHNR